ncbi:MAG: helix-turn-helix domain-containing protein [Candidatus Cloacimonetes bacterium]|nr:helix-turn-helix domain-containing protein [Candidatus Cloacimonadota bacterium]
MKSRGQLTIDGNDYALVPMEEYLEWLEDQEDIEAANQAKLEQGEATPLGDLLAESGNRIAHYRKLKNLNQSELAKILGVTQSHLSRWESGSVAPNTANIIALTKTLDCQVTDLFPGA